MLAISKIVPAITPGLTAKPKATNREGHRSRHQHRSHRVLSSIRSESAFLDGQSHHAQAAHPPHDAAQIDAHLGDGGGRSPELPALLATASHTVRRRRLSSITRAPCRKVMAA